MDVVTKAPRHVSHNEEMKAALRPKKACRDDHRRDDRRTTSQARNPKENRNQRLDPPRVEGGIHQVVKPDYSFRLKNILGESTEQGSQIHSGNDQQTQREAHRSTGIDPFQNKGDERGTALGQPGPKPLRARRGDP
jgi:hypothetical protein